MIFLNNFIDKYNSDDKFQVCIFGDFNLPKFCWDNGSVISTSSNAPSYKLLTDFMNDNFFSQFINENTRSNNILDLFLTNNPNFVHLVKCEDIAISDHNLVKIFTDFFSFPNTEIRTASTVSNKPDFSALNLSKANFEVINHTINSLNWKDWVESLNMEDIPDRFRCLIYSILKVNCPINIYKTKKFDLSNPFKKSRKILARKIRKLNNQLGNTPLNTPSYIAIKNKIKIFKEKQIESFVRERKSSEYSAVSKIKTDKKYFFKYVNKFKTQLTSPIY